MQIEKSAAIQIFLSSGSALLYLVIYEYYVFVTFTLKASIFYRQ